MINHEVSTNKLIILYMLKRIRLPLTNTQLTDFIIERNYTNYFSFQDSLHQLIESNLVRTITTTKSTSYEISSEGMTTLDFFENRISTAIKKDIDLYCKENKYAIKDRLELSAEYIPEVNGDYLVHLVATENGKTLIDLTLNVFDKDIAVKLCDQWNAQHHILYKKILNSLLNDLI